MKRTVAIVLALSVALVASASSEPAAAADTSGTPSATRAGQLTVSRRVQDSGARTAPLTAGLASGYGYTGAVLQQRDRHHRLLGSLLLEGAPAPWLGLGLRLDGRYDKHAFDGQPSDDGWVGEPRLLVRADRQVADSLSAGARGSVFFPGSQAPSWRPGATSAELLALVTHTRERVTITGNAGYRLDRSAHSVMDASRFGPGDRLALGVSAFDAALLGAAVQYHLASWQLFGEWSWEMLVGSGAPSASSWPMRLGAGARTPLSRTLDLEVLVEASPSGRPPMSAEAPLVPVPPRLGLMAGLIMPLGTRAAPATVVKPPDDSRRASDATLTPAPLVSVTLAGEALPPAATVRLERAGEARAFTDEGSGQFALRDVPPGPAMVVVSAPGFDESRTPVRLVGGTPLNVEVRLHRTLPSGQIRGTVHSFDGRVVTATVRVTASQNDGMSGTAGTSSAAELRSQAGSFQVDVPPGRYQVVIEAPGHAAQTRTVLVERNGVTVLNVDLRPAR